MFTTASRLDDVEKRWCRLADVPRKRRDGASVMLAGDMAMRLRKTHGSSSACSLAAAFGRCSLNEFSCAHDHTARSSATQTCARSALTTLSRGGHVAQKKAVQRIRRGSRGNFRVPRLQSTVTGT